MDKISYIVKQTINEHVKKKMIDESIKPSIKNKFNWIVAQLENAYKEMMGNALSNGHSKNEFVFKQINHDINELKKLIGYIR